MPIKHLFTNPKADGGDATITRASDWNADHIGFSAFTNVTADLGVARRSGTFDIAGSGLTPGNPVIIFQSMGAISAKGDARDEAEFDLISATGYVVDASTIRVIWNASGVVVGNYEFEFAVGG